MLHMIRQGIRVGNRLLLRISKQKTILIYIKTGLLKTNEYRLRKICFERTAEFIQNVMVLFIVIVIVAFFHEFPSLL